MVYPLLNPCHDIVGKTGLVVVAVQGAPALCRSLLSSWLPSALVTLVFPGCLFQVGCTVLPHCQGESHLIDMSIALRLCLIPSSYTLSADQLRTEMTDLDDARPS